MRSAWLEANLARISGRSNVTKEICYSLKRWSGRRWSCVMDGRGIDNLATTRGMRPIVPARLNWSFACSDEAIKVRAVKAMPVSRTMATSEVARQVRVPVHRRCMTSHAPGGTHTVNLERPPLRD